jgi:general secretion pathway protein E
MQKKKQKKYFLNKSIFQILKNFFNLNKSNLEIAMKIYSNLIQKKNIDYDKQFLINIISEALSIQIGLPFLENINIESIKEDLIKNVPIVAAKLNNVIPININSANRIIVICSNPLDLELQNQLRIIFKKEIEILVSKQNTILNAINVSYKKIIQKASNTIKNLKKNNNNLGKSKKNYIDINTPDLLEISNNNASIIELVNSLIAQAVKNQASDIHIEPFENEQIIRFRIDGMLYKILKSPKRFQNSIIGRIKIMSNLDISEKRLPQDGRMKLTIAGKNIDIRISIIPTTYGERISMRILHRKSQLINLNNLGFNKKTFKSIKKMLNLSSGIVLITGPTGSGKTSSLYAFLNKLNKSNINILTIENPIEYKINGVSQVQVNNKINLNFEVALRSFLRQDPDIIMIGEIRDKETAEIAIQASLTGHLVFATMHANDSISSITRIIEMGIDPFLVANALTYVLAQRLIRKIHQKCKKNYTPSPFEILKLKLTPNIKQLWKGLGCKQCHKSGYKGRIGIYELLEINDKIKNLIISNTNVSYIRNEAKNLGMRTMIDDGIEKILSGITTINEVSRVVGLKEII